MDRKLVVALSGWVLVVACGSSVVAPAEACTPGAAVACACPGGTKGAQSCRDDGAAFDACQCVALGIGAGADAGVDAATSEVAPADYDAALGIDSNPATGLRCGPARCAVGQQCCVAQDSSTSCGTECVLPNSAITCESQRDCADGQICCGMWNTAGATCTTWLGKSSCGNGCVVDSSTFSCPGSSLFTACLLSSDCPRLGDKCCQSPDGNGYCNAWCKKS